MSALPPISAKFLAATESSGVKITVGTVKLPVAVSGTDVNREIVNAFNAVASKTDTAALMAQAFNFKANVPALEYQATATREFNSGTRQSGQASDTSRSVS